MAFNIKNEETIQIAREIAAETGESISVVFDTSIRERRRRLDDDAVARKRRILRLAADIRSRMPAGFFESTDPVADMLYDPETGMPA